MMTPPVMLKYQAEWLSDTSPVTFCEKSRRVGITYASAAEAVLIAGAKSGSNCYYSGLNREMAQDFVSDAADFARHFNVAASAIEEELFEEDDEKSILSYKISFASGFKIIALSSRPSAIRGKQGVFYVDEAAFHDDLPAMMKACVALLMWGGRVRVISTHFGQDNPFNELIEEARAGKKPFKVHRVTLQEAVSQGLYKRICEVNNQTWTPELETQWVQDLYAFYGDDAGEELDVVPSSESRSYIARRAIEQCMVDEPPVLRLSLPPNILERSEIERQILVDQWIADHAAGLLNALPRGFKSYCGLDFARSGDVSALIVLTELERLTYRVPFVIEMRGVPFDNQRQLVFAVLGRLPHLTRGAFDATGNGSYLAETAAIHFGAKIEPVHFTDKWLRENMPRLRDWLESSRLEIPRHADILADLRAIEIIRGVPKVDPNKRHIGTDNKPRHGDTAIALSLAVYAASGAGEPAAGRLEASGRGRQNPNVSERIKRRSIWLPR